MHFQANNWEKLTIIIYMQQTPGQLQDGYCFYLKGIIKLKVKLSGKHFDIRF